MVANFRALRHHVLSDEMSFQMLRVLESIDRRLESKLSVIRHSVKNISSIRRCVENIDYRVRRMQQNEDDALSILRRRRAFSVQTVDLNFQDKDRECVSHYILISVFREKFEIVKRLSSELLVSVFSNAALSLTHYRVSESSYNSLSMLSRET